MKINDTVWILNTWAHNTTPAVAVVKACYVDDYGFKSVTIAFEDVDFGTQTRTVSESEIFSTAHDALAYAHGQLQSKVASAQSELEGFERTHGIKA